MINFIEVDYQAGNLQNIRSRQLSYCILKKLLTSVIPKIDINEVGLVERINFQDKQQSSIRYIIKDHQGQVLAVKDYSPPTAVNHAIYKV